MRYDAFISYNHAADGGLAPALQDALQHIAKPWYRRRSMTVFRDETNLSASPELFGSITAALDESRYYVLLASPGSARSEWVGKEIAYWSSTKTAAELRMVLVLTDGTLRWDKAQGCFDVPTSTALHPALQQLFQSDPLYIDLREARTQVTGGTVQPGRDFRRLFRHPVAKIAAQIKNVDLDTLEGEDLRQHRRTLRVAWGAAVALIALTVAASFGFVSARSNAQDARDQTRSAQANGLAAQSSAQLQTDAPEALSLAVASDRSSDSTLARQALSTAAAQPITGVFGSPARVGLRADAMAVSPDSRRVATNDGTARIVIWDVASAKPVAQLVDHHAVSVVSMAFDPDGRQLAVSYQARIPRAELQATDLVLGNRGRNVVWDVDQARETDHWTDASAVLASIAFAPNGATIAAGDTGGHLVMWRPDAKVHTSVETGAPSVSSVAFSGDGTRAVTATGNNEDATHRLGGLAIVWDTATEKPLTTIPVGPAVTATAFGPDNTVATGDQLGQVRIWDTTAPADQQAAKTWSDDSPVVHLDFNPSGAELVSGDANGNVVVRDTATGGVLATWSEGTAVTGAAFTADGRTLATGDDHGRVVLRDGRRLAAQAGFHAGILGLAFTPDDDGLSVFTAPDVANDVAGTATRWNAADGTVQPLDGGQPVSHATLSADGRRLAFTTVNAAAGDFSNHVTVVDVVNQRTIDRFDVADLQGTFAFSPDGGILVIATTRDYKSYIEARDLTTHTSHGAIVGDPEVQPQSTVLSGPGPTLSVGSDGTIATVDQGQSARLWPTGDGRLRQLTPGLNKQASWSAVVSPDGHTVATVDAIGTGGDTIAHLWDVASGHRTTVRCSATPSVNVLAFSPDSRTLAIGDRDHRVTLCDVATQRTVTKWSASSTVTSLAFSHDGTQVAAGDDSGRVTRWDASAWLAPRSTLRARVCHTLRGDRSYAAVCR